MIPAAIAIAAPETRARQCDSHLRSLDKFDLSRNRFMVELGH
jgi:hypothetical protein